MDGSGFDHLARGLARAGSRRGIVASLAVLLTGGLTRPAADADSAPASRKRRRRAAAHRDPQQDIQRRRVANGRQDTKQPRDSDRVKSQGRRNRKRRGCLKDGTRCTAKSGRKGDNCQRCCSRVSTPRPGGGRRCACLAPGSTCAQDRQCCSKRCFESVCLACTDTETTCPGAGCVDLQTDDEHCGTCGNACRVNRTCDAGVCVANCGSGLTLCGDDCVNTQSDEANCGACDTACDADQTCESGVCEDICGTGLTLCGDVCVNLQTDEANCGTCGTACTSTEGCEQGSCEPLPCGAGGTCTVFVTNGQIQGNLGGLAGADALCQAAATAAGSLAPAGNYQAWLSDSTTSAASRLAQSSGPYIGIDGLRIAANWAALTQQGLERPIRLSETGALLVQDFVWTNTNPDGTQFSTDPTLTCLEWTSNTSESGLARGQVGGNNFADAKWTNLGNVRCVQTGYLYCFQQS